MAQQIPTAPRPHPAADVLVPFECDDRVQVRNRFDGTWCDGFRVAEVVVYDADRPPRYRLRRLSDDTVLPAQFGHDELVPAP